MVMSSETVRPPQPPPLPKGDKRKKRWMRPRSYRREFMRTHPGLADQLIEVERRKLRSLIWTRRIVTTVVVVTALALWVFLMRHK